jgi:hypothetical protein
MTKTLTIWLTNRRTTDERKEGDECRPMRPFLNINSILKWTPSAT